MSYSAQSDAIFYHVHPLSTSQDFRTPNGSCHHYETVTLQRTYDRHSTEYEFHFGIPSSRNTIPPRPSKIITKIRKEGYTPTSNFPLDSQNETNSNLSECSANWSLMRFTVWDPRCMSVTNFRSENVMLWMRERILAKSAPR
jgi:hypothetical protein